MKRGAATLAVLLLLAGCGRDEPTLPLAKKAFPLLDFRYQDRPLSAWRTLPEDAPPEERAAAAWAIAALEKEPAESLAVLLRLLADPDPSVRLAAVVVTGRLAPASSEAARLLVAQLEAPQEPLRRHARRALGQLGAVALGPLTEALEDERPRVVWGALASLAAVGEAPAGVVERVVRFAREADVPTIRRQALFALPRLGPAGIAHVVGALRSVDLAERSEAATALAGGGPGVVGPVAALLGDEDEELAARAAGILADLGPEADSALVALLEALERAGPVRFNAAEALIAIGAPAVPHLDERSKSEDEGLAAIARYALGQIGGD